MTDKVNERGIFLKKVNIFKLFGSETYFGFRAVHVTQNQNFDA